MAVKLRLRRMGRRKLPVWSIVATDSRNARDGRHIEDIGRYYPLEQPARVRLDEDRVMYWLEEGAQPSDTVRSLLSRQGFMLALHMKRKGSSEEEIQEAVEAHREAQAEKEDLDVKTTALDRAQQALEEEAKRVAELEEEERKKAEAKRKEEEEAKAAAEKEAAEKAAAEKEAAEKKAAEERAVEKEAKEEVSAGEDSTEEASAEEADQEETKAEADADHAKDASEDEDSDSDEDEEEASK